MYMKCLCGWQELCYIYILCFASKCKKKTSVNQLSLGFGSVEIGVFSMLFCFFYPYFKFRSDPMLSLFVLFEHVNNSCSSDSQMIERPRQTCFKQKEAEQPSLLSWLIERKSLDSWRVWKVDGLDYSARRQPGKAKRVLRMGWKRLVVSCFDLLCLRCPKSSWMLRTVLWKVFSGFYLEEGCLLRNDPHNQNNSQEMSLSSSINS